MQFLDKINILTWALVLFLITFIYWRIIPEKARKSFLFITSVLFVSSYSIISAVYFLFNIALTYWIAALIIQKVGQKRNFLKLLLIWLIGNLVFFKCGNFISGALAGYGRLIFSPALIKLPKIILPLGISYVIFRLIHYIVEVYRGNIEQGAFVDFALYILFFPTFLAGPVERFQRFYPQSSRPRLIDFEKLNAALYRLCKGLVKKYILADSLATLILPVLSFPQDYSRQVVIIAVYALAIRIYLDFSGYTDMAIGVARLFGYEVMENFNRPFFQKNIVLFWRNWHISVSSWIRDYFFFPLFGSRASVFKLYLGIFLSMVIFHLWHAVSFGFLMLGIYHGVGIILWQLFQEIKKRVFVIEKVFSYRWLDPVSVFFTFSFVSFGFIFFNAGFRQSLGIFKAIFLKG